MNEKPRQSIAINDRNGNALTSDEGRRKQWREHFVGILNREEPADPLIRKMVNSRIKWTKRRDL